MVRVLVDLGVAVFTLGAIDEGKPQFDYEGVECVIESLCMLLPV
jgi:hypothetical protein